MAVVSTAIVLSFHLKSKPSDLELRMATPLGAIFWTLSVLGLMLGVGNYISKFSGSGLLGLRVVRRCTDWNIRDCKYVQP